MDRSTIAEILNLIIPSKVYPSGGNFNFRCPLCGDSKKSKSKRRGWVLVKPEQITYYCHNCTVSISLQHLVKELDLQVHNRFFRNKDINVASEKIQNVDAKLVSDTENVDTPKLVTDVSEDFMPVSFHLLAKDLKSIALKELQYKALSLVIQRGIPKNYYFNFFVCYEKSSDDEKNFENRLIIPYYFNDIVYCFQGRALYDGMEPKYKTWNKENTKIFNYFSAKPEEYVNITEGPVDAMFLKNGISTSGTIKFEGPIFNEVTKQFPKRNWIFDNDSTGIRKAIEWAEYGERVFCWPKSWKNFKDVNEVFSLKKLTLDELNFIISQNVYAGLLAITKMKVG